MPSLSGGASGAMSGAQMGSAFGPWGTAIGAGIGGLAGLFGGGGKGGETGYTKEQKEAQKYWMKRAQDQEAQATAWGEGSRTKLEGQFDDLWDNPGYTPEEQAGLYYSPEEQARMRITPEEEAAVVHMAGAPVAGAANAARDSLLRGSAARGGYAPGLNASVQRVQQEQGRQAAEAVLGARLGITRERRLGDTNIANQRVTAQRDIGQTRIGGRQFAAGGRTSLLNSDRNAAAGFAGIGSNGAFNAGPRDPSTVQKIAGGAIDALGNMDWGSWGKNPTQSKGNGDIWV